MPSPEPSLAPPPDARLTLAPFAHTLAALALGFAISLVGGTVGLGGAAFRLPALVAVLGYGAKAAAPINLLVNSLTVLVSVLTRLSTGALTQAVPYLPLIVALLIGAAPLAYVGASLFRRVSNRGLTTLFLFMLYGLGALLVVESVIGQIAHPLLGDEFAARELVALGFGVGVGLLVSLLGVGGNEFMIPILLYIFGVPVHAAGSTSMLVSVPTVCVSIWRYGVGGSFDHLRSEIGRTIVPMAIGSVGGAIAGSLLAPNVPAGAIKFLLGIVLLFSAWYTFRPGRRA